MSYVRKFYIPDELRKYVKALDRDEDMCIACQRCHNAPALAARIALDALEAWEAEEKPARNDDVRWLETLYRLTDPRN